MSFHYNKKKTERKKDDAWGWKFHLIKNLYLERLSSRQSADVSHMKTYIQSLLPIQKTGVVVCF